MLLTIAIPTFNRSDKLLLQLENVCSQISLLENKNVCLLIQDNCSTDNTEEICSLIIEKYNSVNISYYKNERNLGFDRNVDLCVKNSNSDYVWTLSDDDDLKFDAIEKIIYYIDENYGEFNFAFINYSVRFSSGEAKVKCPNVKSGLVDGMDLLYEIELSHSFISSCIFEASAWKGVNIEPHIGSLWVHLLAARDIMPTGKSLIISNSLIVMNMPSLQESRKSIIKKNDLEFYTNAHIKISAFCQNLEKYGYSKKLVNYLVDGCRKYDSNQIVNYKMTVERNSIIDLYRLAKAYYSVQNSYIKYYFYLLPIIFLPKECFILAKRLKDVIK
ncbi:MAG: glycosyltransferase family 2 protein [Colwelliaceae bacterium]|nr:glycosyltransferase family 2 protein [Colwelliaceae bacterium]